MLAQLGGGDNPITSLLMWFVFLAIFGSIYPRMMLHQIIWKLEKDAVLLEGWGKKTKNTVLKKMTKTPDKEVTEAVNKFLDFFMSTPVDMDPNGIVKKLDRTVTDMRDRFTWFIDKYSDETDTEMKANLEDGIGGAWTVTYLGKIIRHFVETVKKYKNPYIAMGIQMQLPMIMDYAKAQMKATEVICNGGAIGDAIGPYIAADMMGEAEPVIMKEEEMAYAERDIKGRKCIVCKAMGPGSRVGFPGKGLEMLIEKYKPTRIVTIDAAAKLEGEKTGTVAEGVGVAMGGFGIERYYIEEKATKNNVPIDAVIVKMKMEEAILAMREEILDAAPGAKELVEIAIQRAPEGSNVIVLGVGNTGGVGNNASKLTDTDKMIRENAKKAKKEEQEAKNEKKGFWDSISPFSSAFTLRLFRPF